MLRRVRVLTIQSDLHQGPELDPHDFVITIRIGDSKLDKMRLQVQAAKNQGQDIKAMQAQLLDAELADIRPR